MTPVPYTRPATHIRRPADCHYCYCHEVIRATVRAMAPHCAVSEREFRRPGRLKDELTLWRYAAIAVAWNHAAPCRRTHAAIARAFAVHWATVLRALQWVWENPRRYMSAIAAIERELRELR